jgi:hypothetical protein
MVQPRHVVCLLGNWRSFGEIEGVIADKGGEGFELDLEYSRLEPDPRMASAFAASADRVSPSMTDEDKASIRDHLAVAYVLSPPIPQARGTTLSRQMLSMIGGFIDAGATAVKGESSGIAHGLARWREMSARAAHGNLLDRTTNLRRAWVRRPIKDGELIYTCGMHLLGERDVELAATDDVAADLMWMDLLATFLLAEQPEGGVQDGEGFRQKEDGERRVLRAHPCTRYAEDDFFYNPYGYWRLDRDSAVE